MMSQDGASQRPEPAIRALVVERQRLFAAALAAVLAADPDLEVLGHLQEFEGRLEDIATMRPDVAVVNFALLRVEADIVDALHAECPGAKVLVLAEKLDEVTLAACAQAGTVGAVAMDTDPDDLARAIKLVHAGENLFASHVLFRLVNQPRRGPVLVEPTYLRGILGPRERDVLQAAAVGLSVGETAIRLSVSVHTVRTHLRNVLKKLGAHSKLEAVLIAIRMGLIRLPE